jgi:hypothetical protein
MVTQNELYNSNGTANGKESEKRLFANSKLVETNLIFFQDKIIFTAMEDPTPAQAFTYLHCVKGTSRKNFCLIIRRLKVITKCC